MSPHSAFDVILRETIAEVVAAEAIDEADLRQSQDEIEQLRLQAAHLVTMDSGGPWATGAPVQFAKAEPLGGAPTMDIRYPPRPRVQESVEVPQAREKPAVPSPRQGRRIPNRGTQDG